MADKVKKRKNVNNKAGKKNVEKQRKSDKVKQKGEVVKNGAPEGDSSFNVEDILYLGGEKEDYDKLLEIDADAEMETGLVQGDTDKLRDEIQNLLQSGGFDDILGQNTVHDVAAVGLKDKSGCIVTGKTVNKHSKNNIKNNVKTISSDNKMIDNPTGKVKKSKKCSNTETATEEEINRPCSEKKIKNDTKTVVVEPGGKKSKNSDSKPAAPLFKSLEYKKYDRLLLKNSLPWYELTKNIPKAGPALHENEIDDLYSVVKQYWETETEIYQQMKDNDRSSDAKWLRTVLTSGTLSDKVAALTMLNQESPVHCMRSLEALMNMSRKKARREALIAIDSLRHLWIADLLPDYKLRQFNEFPIEQLNEYNKSRSKEENIKLLITIIFEDSLKKTYSDFVEILQSFSKDPLSDIRNKILGIVSELLQMKPEQEQVLLSILVNKLGDPDRKVASKASYLLCQLVTKHPNMKVIVIKEVERMMYRPNMSDKAQYYAICFLNQIILSHQEKSTASKLISIYFSFFKLIAARDDKRKGKSKGAKGASSEHKNKLLGGLLTGVNRAYPYVEDMNETYDDQLDTLFRLAHVKHLNTSVQAFMLIYQVMQSRQSLSDRYYQALYGKLLDPDISMSCKHTMFLNLIFKSLKNDPVLKRVKAFIKRLLQICTQEQPSLLCGILYLISEVIKTNPGINNLIMQHEDQDEEEHFVDAPLDEEVINNKLDSTGVECENKDCANSGKGVKESWTFLKQENKHSYNINHRNPLYTGAEKSCLWEIVPLLSQFHPSVVHFAMSVINGKEIQYKGDPSQDFTLISFLDRFMYRNPKQKDIEHGSSLMQRKETSLRRKEEPVNSKLFLQKSEDDVPCDQLFFHRYFKQQMTGKDLKKEDKDEMYETEIENLDDIDFAGEMKKNSEINRKKKGKKDDDGSDSESGEEQDKEDSFDYDNMEEESSDEDEPVKKDNYNDKDFEKALFETLDSDGESINDDDDANALVEDDPGADSMFADADEFSHLMEGDNDNIDGVHRKQIQWEEKQDQKHWGYKKNRNKGNMKRKMNTNHNRSKPMKKKAKK